jgi:hypothetical protein
MANVVSAKAATTGVISRDSAYSLDEFKARTRTSDHALRQARRAGLQIRYAGRRGYILGSDWLEFIAAAPRQRGQR